jgi:hypothetical protein
MKLDDDMPDALLPDFFGRGGGVALRATGTFEAAAPETAATGPAVAGRSGAACEEPPLAASGRPLGAGGLPAAVGSVAADDGEFAGDCQLGGAVTATKLRHLGHSMICPTTARS